MCGIIGLISNNEIEKEKFISLVTMLDHRGPDDKGVFFDDKIALGQTRLSIIDLSKDGHQPMLSQDEKYVITFNGEIYNFAEIKKDLLLKGYIFNSKTDTEVILNGFIEYGEKIAEKLNGMFAFAIYDKLNDKVFFARDRSGMKPLYYYHSKTDFYFSSEVKALKHLSNEINFDSKILFLLLGSVPEPYTIYKGISMFPSGTYGYLHKNRLDLTNYDKYEYEPKIIKPYNEIITDVKELLHKSVERHLISDAPIGTFLSGGLDSSAITAIASKYKTDLQTISLVFDDKQLSEEYYQDLVVNRCGTKHNKYLIDEQLFLNSIDNFTESIDQPTIDGLNTYFVSKAANQIGLRTVLSGVGGDEIFYGYSSFKNSKKLNLIKKLPAFVITILKQFKKLKKIELLEIENVLSLYLPTRALFSPREISEILKIDISLVYNTIVKLWELNNQPQANYIDDKISFLELNMYMKNQLLRDTDVFGMANSLEIRVPFLDKELVNYINKIEPNIKYDKNINKIILADAVKSLLPHEIFNRPKMGFTLPFEKWFRNNINTFDIDNSLKRKFLNNELHWSRIWALIVINKFN
jgi:asparagine synthase (glutamine-hydrolysing)